MSYSQSLVLVVSLAGLLPAYAEPEAGKVEGKDQKPAYRDAQTHDQIVKKLSETNQKNPFAKLSKSEGEDPSLKNRPENLITSSDIISYNGNTTLVPKHAIIQIPEKYKSRINNHVKGNKIISWMDFYALNRGWITTVEVSKEQAEGRKPLAEDVSESFKKNSNMIIATYSTGPISLLPLKEPKETPQKTNGTNELDKK